MAAPISNAIAAYTNAGRAAGAAGPAAASGGESFAGLLKEAAGDVGDALHKSEAASLRRSPASPTSRRSPPRSTTPRRRSPSS
jgi:flagellar hook-basal body complex protein FliE